MDQRTVDVEQKFALLRLDHVTIPDFLEHGPRGHGHLSPKSYRSQERRLINDRTHQRPNFSFHIPSIACDLEMSPRTGLHRIFVSPAECAPALDYGLLHERIRHSVTAFHRQINPFSAAVKDDRYEVAPCLETRAMEKRLW